MEKLLLRQLKKSRMQLETLSPECRQFLELVNEAYLGYEQERVLLQHAMDLSSKEMWSKTEQLAQAVAKVRREAKFRAEFLANISHEIRTPLNGILGLVDQLLEDMPDPQEVINHLDLVRKSARGLMAVINDVLDLSKIESGKLSILPSPNDLREIFGETMQIFSSAFRERHLQFVLEVSPEIPSLVMVDDGRLRQILTNLIGNSVKFTPAHGGIVVHVSTQSDKDERSLLHVVVSDSGVGISEAMQSAIFEPFVQADTSITREYGGTGLGLAISHQLVRSMGGNLWVKSLVGVGSAFHFTLPLMAAPVIDASSHMGAETSPVTGLQASVIAPAECKILLVEDNEINLKVALQALCKLGYRVDVARNGREAVEAFGAGTFDLILMDCQMPEMSGFEATSRIRSTRAGESIPIVALTAMGMEGDLERCLAAGMDAYLTKPFNRKELSQTISQWIACKRRVTPG